MWHADYFIHCDTCDNTEWMDGRTIKDAARTARGLGWLVNGKHATCPKCLPAPRALKRVDYYDASYAELEGPSFNPYKGKPK